LLKYDKKTITNVFCFLICFVGGLKYCTNGKLKSIKAGLHNQLKNFEQFLQYRLENPQELRIEGVFSFNSWGDFEELSWPETTEATHDQIVKVFLNSGAIYLMPKEIFKKQISLCLL